MAAAANPESNPRFQKIDKLGLLALCPLFSPLSPWELQSIGQLMRLVEFKKDEVVYREGEEASGFYVVVSGRFEAFVAESDKKKVLAYLRRGDFFGEMSLLTGQPHSATLRALSDCLVLELKKDDFHKTIESNATISLELSRRLSSRLKGVSQGQPRPLLKSDILSVYSHRRRAGRAAFSINLAASLVQETRQKTVLLDMSPTGNEIASRLKMGEKTPLTRFVEIENATADALVNVITRHPVGFDVLSVAHDPIDRAAAQVIIPLLNHLAVDYRFILIDLPSGFDELVMKVFSQSDSIYFVTDSSLESLAEARDTVREIQHNLSFQEDRVSVVISEVFVGNRTPMSVKKELFGKKPCYSLPAAPALFEGGERNAAPYVVEEPHTEYSRVIRHVARRVSGNLVGLVLGSGAALGLAHVGVLKVLERERIPVDMISGSSIGAMIAALFALGYNAAEIEEVWQQFNARASVMGLVDPSPFPLRGLLQGHAVMRFFKRYYGDKTFDDCRIPLRVTGANLSTRQLATFDSGFVADAVRTSIAIPAIFKPTTMDGETLVDGGILSPLPIRALHQAGADKVIAVNVFPTSKETLERRIVFQEAAEKEALEMRKRGIFARAFYRMRRGIAHRFTPNVFDILMNTIQTMESEIAEMEGEGADVLLRPVVPTASWVEFYKPTQFIRRGEEETERLLPKIRALVSQQNA